MKYTFEKSITVRKTIIMRISYKPWQVIYSFAQKRSKNIILYYSLSVFTDILLNLIEQGKLIAITDNFVYLSLHWQRDVFSL